MKKRILFALASPIIRPNGIVVFMKEASSVLKQMGHTVDFITDAEPKFNIGKWFDNVYYPKNEIVYPLDTTIDGKPIINFLPQIQNRIRDVYQNEIHDCEYDVIISNDAQSTAAFLDLQNKVRLIHYVHTGGLIDENATFLTDHYVEMERLLLDHCEVGAQHQRVLDTLGVKGHVLHMPLGNLEWYLPHEDQSGLMFLGEGTKRKGALRFEKIVNKLDIPARILSTSFLDTDFGSIVDKTIGQFGIHEEQKKATFIRKGKAGFHPAICECWPYAVMEMLVSKPVVLDATYRWARPFEDVGALVVQPEEIEETIKMVMDPVYKYDNSKAVDYFKQAPATWRRHVAGPVIPPL